jgi:hypothetical protein
MATADANSATSKWVRRALTKPGMMRWAFPKLSDLPYDPQVDPHFAKNVHRRKTVVFSRPLLNAFKAPPGSEAAATITPRRRPLSKRDPIWLARRVWSALAHGRPRHSPGLWSVSAPARDRRLLSGLEVSVGFSAAGRTVR